MFEVMELTKLGESPKLYRPVVVEPSPYGWCVLKRRPRGGQDEFGHLVSEPDEVILQDRPIGTSIGNGIPFMRWWDVFDRLNPSAGARLYGRTPEAQKFNNDQDPDEREIDDTQPINIRCSGDGGNLKAFYLETQTATHIQLVAFDYLYPVDAEGKDFYSHPWLFTFPSAINSAGQVTKVANGINVFFPQIERKETGLWIRKSEVIMLSKKPEYWGIEDVMGQWV